MNRRPSFLRRVSRGLAVLAALAVTVAVPGEAEAVVDWSPTPVSGALPLGLPSTAHTLSGTCHIEGGSGIVAPPTGPQIPVAYTITQSQMSGARVVCTVLAVYTVQQCFAGTCYTVPASDTFQRQSEPIFVDQTPPVGLSASSAPPNAAGWLRGSATVVWHAVDPESGVGADACDVVPLASLGDTASGLVEGGCVNGAGLRARSSFSYKYDGTAPALAPTVTPAVVGLGDAVSADAGATDATSGVAASQCNGGQPLDTTTVGIHTVTCTARDVAGNTASASTTYAVTYGFGSFAAPVDADAVNVAKAGQAVPLKFSVTGVGGEPVTDLASVTVRVSAMTCDLGDTASLLEEQAVGGSGLRHLGDGNYQFNWASPKSYAGSCKTLHLDLGDGVTHDLTFRFEK